MAEVICAGCGLMGSHLIQAFIDEKHSVTVANRTHEKVLPFEKQGAAYFPTLRQALERSDAELIVVNVLDYEAAAGMISSCRDALKGRVVVNLTTVEAAGAAGLQTLVTGLGGHFVCGSITCYPKNIGAHRDGSIVFAGDEAAYRRISGILEALSPANFFIGSDPALASVFDAVWLAPHYGMIWGIVQGAASCKEHGIDVSLYTDSVKVMLTAFLNVICESVKNTIAKDSFPAHAADSTIEAHIGGLRAISSCLGGDGFDTSPTDAILHLAEKAASAGDINKDITAMANYLKR